ncbi:MAG: tRNA pseudouridine(55) synthase TruB [Xanthomonadaceae bacterium]|nr:tRNA pseudouridine(55) synthase TruB [Xanthomonadaceae bacterium]
MSRKSFRRLDGILLLDKPVGISSNAALQRARKIFRAEKAGHTGSLDPLASGLLPLCFGEATKIAGLLLESDKAYEADIVLGISTDTDDAEGQVLLERPLPPIDVEILGMALQPFIGRIQQRAPIYSALKQGGEPLYRRARRGETIEAPIREVEIHSIDILEHAGARLRLRIVCGSGTYIRSLARDLGDSLGCGAHIAGLRRLWVAPFRAPRMHTLETLETLRETNQGDGLHGCLLPLEAGLKCFPAIVLSPSDSVRFRQGQRLRGSWGTRALSVVMNDSGRALGLGEVREGGLLSPRRLFNESPDADGQ